MNISRLLHSSLLVADLARARQFYEGVLGFQPSVSRPTMSFDGVWYDFGEQQLHLLHLPNPEDGLKRPAHGGRDRHVAFAVDDLDALVGRLVQADIPHTLSQSGRRALFCRDPDANALEFIEL